MSRCEGATVLVTGAGGFLGTALVDRLAQAACTIRRVHRPGRPPDAPREQSAARFDDREGDIRDLQTWLDCVPGADIVLHLAAQTSSYVAADDPGADLTANVVPVLHLATACRRVGQRPQVVFAGTATQVGLTTSASPAGENLRDLPVTVYDVHKLMAEQYLEVFTREGAMAATTLRLTNVYGPGTTPRSTDRGFLMAMIRRAIEGQALTRYGSGEFVRDYVYVDDVVRAFIAAIESPSAVAGRHFVIGSGVGTTIARALELVGSCVTARTGRPVDIRAVDPPAGVSAIEGRQFVADSSAFERATGWRAEVRLDDGIARAVDSLMAAHEARP
jgi:nucleoside-diphosphate-sugar epimerase